MKEIGILDPDGKYKNPLTGKKYSQKYYDLANIIPAWRDFPMYKEAKKIIKLIEKHRVCVIESGTGTGKTVILPKLALHTLDYKGKVVMTIPKKAATLSSASFAAACLDVKLGQEVGFQYSGSKIESGEGDDIIEESSKSAKTKLLFSTEGSVLQQLIRDPYMKEYDIVVIDEAHERSIEIDRLLVLLREALLLNDKLKVIITSATLPPQLFENYFREKGISVGEMNIDPLPNKPVDIVYSKQDIKVKERANETYKIYFKEIIDKNKEGDTLIFSTGLKKAKTLCKDITSKDNTIFCVEATSKTVEKDEDIQEVLSKETLESLIEKGRLDSKYKYKVIIATKIYESSVTLNPLIYVIDNGLNSEQNYDPERMEDQLNTEIISQAQAIQRKGRAGRLYPGICYRAYSEKQYEKMLKNPIVPIKKNNIIEMLLSLMTRADVANLSQLLDFLRLFIERPPKPFVESALRTLHALDLIDNLSAEGKITEKGKLILEINSKKVFNIYSSIALYYAKIYNCSKEVSMIIAGLGGEGVDNIDSFFLKANDRREEKELEERKRSFKVDDGDAFSIYEILTRFLKAEVRDRNDVRAWCRRNYLQYSTINKIVEKAIAIYHKTPKVEGEQEYDIPDLKDRVCYCLLKGYFPNLAQYTGKTKKVFGNELALYKNFFPMKKSIAPISDSSYINKANFVIYNKLYSSNNLKSIVLVTKIRKDIVALLNDFEKNYLDLAF